jgi:hypothetical protein
MGDKNRRHSPFSLHIGRERSMRNRSEGGNRTHKADDWGVAAVIAVQVRFPLPY